MIKQQKEQYFVSQKKNFIQYMESRFATNVDKIYTIVVKIFEHIYHLKT
jgi:hypothetical protein